MNKAAALKSLRNGVNQKEVRDHNERLILSVLQRNGHLSGSEIARRTHLSAQTVSVILRKLERDSLVIKGKPVKGKVGKPSVPMALNPKGAVSIGYKLGRRSSEVIVTDLCGKVLFQDHLRYDIALPQTIFDFMRKSFEAALREIGQRRAAKLCGIGIAAPFEIWKWGASDGNIPSDFLSWKDVSFEQEVARFTDLPVFMVNDGTSACWAEQVYGQGRELQDYAYFFVSTFIGGGVVLNQSVYDGGRGNAAAFAPLRVGDRHGRTRQLLDIASIHSLEAMLIRSGHDPRELWTQPQDWTAFAKDVDVWIDEAAYGIAQACVSVCAVIDFEAVIVDGFFPASVRRRLVTKIRDDLLHEDSRGLILPRLLEGRIGVPARSLGAASIPIFAQYFLGAHSALAD